MFLRRTCTTIPVLASLALLSFGASLSGSAVPVRDTAYFLHRLRTIDHLPQLEESHTALASTWDRTGANADGTDFKRVEGTTNVLLDVDGPGVIHRLFTGGSEPGRPDLPGYLNVDGTRVQVLLDGAEQPGLDFPVTDFFDPDKGPIPAPLAGDKAHGWTYPGSLFPIPYARHARVQIVNPEGKNWGCYWQVTYTTFPKGTPVETLQWPLPIAAKAELEAVQTAWREAQSTPPPPPARWTDVQEGPLASGKSIELRRTGVGVIRELRVAVEPATPEALRSVRLTMTWNGASRPSVDMPVGDFFGHRRSGHAEAARFSSLLLGVTKDEAYSRFPMPFGNGAVIALRNDSAEAVARVRIAIAAEVLPSLPPEWGLFEATHREARAAVDGGPRYGPRAIPGHRVLEADGAGKYVGVLMRTDWPHDGWWGEGDWMIWTDEQGWPPSYHGTGSEEYFNSGWCLFDRKAISGYVAIHPGYPSEYSFHLNDAFQFQHRLEVAVETVGWDKADVQIREEHPVWATTAYWYARPPSR